jgi:CxxC motif-containing protein
MEKLICITCPRSCHLSVEKCDGQWLVSGNMCPRGKSYAEQELTDPRRVVTAVIRCDDPVRPLLPVRSNRPYPKSEIAASLNELYRVEVKTPVARGEVVYDISGHPEIKIVACEKRNGEKND